MLGLPSKHRFGRLVVNHREGRKTLYTPDDKPFFACWYADVKAQSLDIVSGHHLFMVFDLVRAHGGHNEHSYTRDGWPWEQDGSRTLPQAPLQRWLSLDSQRSIPGTEDDPELIYMLNHKYASDATRLVDLWHDDFARVKSLQGLAGKIGLVLYLAQVERRVESLSKPRSGSSNAQDDGYKSATDGNGLATVSFTLMLKRVVDLDGNEIATCIDIDEQNILQEQPYPSDREPDDEKQNAGSTSQSSSSEQIYRDAVGGSTRVQQSMY